MNQLLNCSFLFNYVILTNYKFEIVSEEVDITSSLLSGKVAGTIFNAQVTIDRSFKKMFRQERNQLLNCSFMFNYVILTNYVI